MWKSIPGFPAYLVSSYGEVKRVRRYKQYPAGLVLRPKINRRGYLEVSLQESGKVTSIMVHRLVAMVFLGSPPDGMDLVLHNDDDQRNNHASNLRYGTHQMNASDRVRNGKARPPKGEQHHNAALTEETVRIIRERRRSGETLVSLATSFGVTGATICDAIKRRTWKHVE